MSNAKTLYYPGVLNNTKHVITDVTNGFTLCQLEKAQMPYLMRCANVVAVFKKCFLLGKGHEFKICKKKKERNALVWSSALFWTNPVLFVLLPVYSVFQDLTQASSLFSPLMKNKPQIKFFLNWSFQLCYLLIGPKCFCQTWCRIDLFCNMNFVKHVMRNN